MFHETVREAAAATNGNTVECQHALTSVSACHPAVVKGPTRRL